MKRNESITHIMSKDLVTVHDHEPVSRVRQIFAEHPLHHLPVVSGENLVGIIAWNDYLRVTFGDSTQEDPRAVDAVLDHTYKLEDLMRRDPVTLSLHGTIRDAAEILGKPGFHSLPVVDGRKLVGLVTSTDLIRYLYEALS